MVQIVYFVILIIGFCCLIKNNKSKINSVVLSIGIFVIFAGNNSNSDYNLYLYSMMTDDYDRYEIGYRLYYFIFKKIGITDYQETVIITFIILGILLYWGIKKITDNYVGVLFLLLISELFIGTVQFRTMIASVLLFDALILYKDNKKIALVIALISSSFQMVTLFFIPFFIIGLIKKENKYKIDKGKYELVGVLFGIYLILLLLNNVLHVNLPLIGIEFLANKWSVFEHVTYYFGGTAWGSIPFAGLYFVNLITVCYIRRYVKSYDDRYSDTIFNINIYAAFSLPLLFVDINFYRMFRVLNIANYVYYAWALGNNKKKSISFKQLKMFGFVCGSQFFWVWSYLSRIPEIFTEIIKNNIWIG